MDNIGTIGIFKDKLAFDDFVETASIGSDEEVIKAILAKAEFKPDDETLQVCDESLFPLLLGHVDRCTIELYDRVYDVDSRTVLQFLEKCTESPQKVFGEAIYYGLDEDAIIEYYNKHHDDITITPRVVGDFGHHDLDKVSSTILSGLKEISFESAEKVVEYNVPVEELHPDLIVKVTEEQQEKLLGTIFEDYLEIV